MITQRPTWTFTDGKTLAIGTMYCIGRNYAAHAIEMGATVPGEPIVFLKPPAAYRKDGSTIVLPSWTDDVHHEVELVVVIGSEALDIGTEHAWDVVAGVGVGLDLTARDIQSAAKKEGHPWAIAKAWCGSAPVSSIVPISSSGRGPWDLTCSVNDEMRQQVSTQMMERTVEQMTAFLSSVFTLVPGDCIFTGTPDGVGSVRRGDVVTASLSDIATLTVQFT